jgi:hypothetical protein
MSVDVSGMLCAQALAVVARAIERVALGATMHVRYDAEDVRRDLVTWALDRGHGIHDEPPSTLRLERRR